MVIDVDHRCRSHVGLRCLDVLRLHALGREHHALNVVLAGQWGELDPRWNQGADVHAYPYWTASP
jgi:hypothetical protein